MKQLEIFGQYLLSLTKEFKFSDFWKRIWSIGTFREERKWKSYAFAIAIGLISMKVAQKIYKKLHEKSFKGKLCVVTGGAKGLGKILSRKLLEEGAKVIIWDIDEKSGLKCKEDFKEYFSDDLKGRLYFQNVNVADRESVHTAAKQIKKQIGRVDVLINNAGIVNRETVFDCDEETIERVFGVNTLSHFWTVRAFAPGMIKRDHGHIVTISSCAGLVGVAGLQSYCASKFSAFGFAESLRLQFKRNRNHVDSLLVLPYYMKGPMFNGVNSLIPLLEPEYVARRIIQSMKDRDPDLVVPGWLRYITYGSRLFLPHHTDDVQHVLGITKSMDGIINKEKRRKRRLTEVELEDIIV